MWAPGWLIQWKLFVKMNLVFHGGLQNVCNRMKGGDILYGLDPQKPLAFKNFFFFALNLIMALASLVMDFTLYSWGLAESAWFHKHVLCVFCLGRVIKMPLACCWTLEHRSMFPLGAMMTRPSRWRAGRATRWWSRCSLRGIPTSTTRPRLAAPPSWRQPGRLL